MRKITNTEELIFKIQKYSVDCGLKPRRMNRNPTLRDNKQTKKYIKYRMMRPRLKYTARNSCKS